MGQPIRQENSTWDDESIETRLKHHLICFRAVHRALVLREPHFHPTLDSPEHISFPPIMSDEHSKVLARLCWPKVSNWRQPNTYPHPAMDEEKLQPQWFGLGTTSRIEWYPVPNQCGIGFPPCDWQCIPVLAWGITRNDEIGFKYVAGLSKNLGPFAGFYFVIASEAAFIPHDCEAASWMFWGADRCTGIEHRAGDSCLVDLTSPCTTCVARPPYSNQHVQLFFCGKPWGGQTLLSDAITPMPQLRRASKSAWQRQLIPDAPAKNWVCARFLPNQARKFQNFGTHLSFVRVR